VKKAIKLISYTLILSFVFSFYGPIYADDTNLGGNAGNSLSANGDFDSQAIDTEKYKLGPDDQIALNFIFGDHDSSTNYTFSLGPDGKIYFPNVGEIDLLGLTIPQAKDLIDQKIKTLYPKKYQFSFLLIQPRRMQVYLSGQENKPLYMGNSSYVYVYGEVSKSGRFEYLPGKKFSDYISYAGGPAAQANLDGSTITRNGQKFNIKGSGVIFDGNIKADMEIMPGDVINVPRNFFYFTDFMSFSTLAFTILAFYNTFIKK